MSQTIINGIKSNNWHRYYLTDPALASNSSIARRALLNITAFHKKILNILLFKHHDNYKQLSYTYNDVSHVWNTDSNKSFDFLLNPICIMFVFMIIVLFYSNVC